MICLVFESSMLHGKSIVADRPVPPLSILVWKRWQDSGLHDGMLLATSESSYLHHGGRVFGSATAAVVSFANPKATLTEYLHATCASSDLSDFLYDRLGFSLFRRLAQVEFNMLQRHPWAITDRVGMFLYERPIKMDKDVNHLLSVDFPSSELHYVICRVCLFGSSDGQCAFSPYDMRLTHHRTWSLFGKLNSCSVQ